MMILRYLRRGFWVLAAITAVCPLAQAAEHVTLKNGFELDCVRREPAGERVRLFFTDSPGGSVNYMEVAADSIMRIEATADQLVPARAAFALKSTAGAGEAAPSAADIRAMLTQAGQKHHIDADMLASVIQAESGGHVRAVSRTGARGLMQLMPGTAQQLGVADSFQPDQNIAGGTAYFDQLMTRYHDNVRLALAAYNAGPGAVDRWHGIPPYRETQAYVARVIHEFNRRKQIALPAGVK